MESGGLIYLVEPEADYERFEHQQQSDQAVLNTHHNHRGRSGCCQCWCCRSYCHLLVWFVPQEHSVLSNLLCCRHVIPCDDYQYHNNNSIPKPRARTNTANTQDDTQEPLTHNSQQQQQLQQQQQQQQLLDYSHDLDDDHAQRHYEEDADPPHRSPPHSPSELLDHRQRARRKWQAAADEESRHIGLFYNLPWYVRWFHLITVGLWHFTIAFDIFGMTPLPWLVRALLVSVFVIPINFLLRGFLICSLHPSSVLASSSDAINYAYTRGRLSNSSVFRHSLFIPQPASTCGCVNAAVRALVVLLMVTLFAVGVMEMLRALCFHGPSLYEQYESTNTTTDLSPMSSIDLIGLWLSSWATSLVVEFLLWCVVFHFTQRNVAKTYLLKGSQEMLNYASQSYDSETRPPNEPEVWSPVFSPQPQIRYEPPAEISSNHQPLDPSSQVQDGPYGSLCSDAVSEVQPPEISESQSQSQSQSQPPLLLHEPPDHQMDGDESDHDSKQVSDYSSLQSPQTPGLGDTVDPSSNSYIAAQKQIGHRESVAVYQLQKTLGGLPKTKTSSAEK